MTAVVPPSRQYFAIRSCERLKGAAIFSERDDCSQYLDGGEKAWCLYKICQTLQQALDFIEPSSVEEEDEFFPAVEEAESPEKRASAGTAEATTEIETSPQTGTSQNDSTTQTTPVSQRKAPPAAAAAAAVPPAAPLVAAADTGTVSARKSATPPRSLPVQRSPAKRKGADAQGEPAKKRHRKIDEKLALRREQQFEEMMALLKEYKELYNTTDLSPNYVFIEGTKFEKLGQWMTAMRKEIRKGPEESYLGAERIQRLHDIGFCMNPRFTKIQARMNAEFDEMFQQLKTFRETHKKDPPDPTPPERKRTPLRCWAIKIREEYTKMKRKGEASPYLTVERMAKLSSIGFNLSPGGTRKSFEDRAKDWLDYKIKHGHDPPTSEESLYHFTTKIRRAYRLRKEGKDNRVRLTQEQIDMMKKWGFDWGKEPSKFSSQEQATKPKKWEERFQELLEYKAQHGTTVVPQRCPGLGAWVKSQRKEYQKLRRNLPTKMKPERLQRLKSIGFVFEVRKSGLRPERRIYGQKKNPMTAELHLDLEPSSSEEEDGGLV